MKKIDVINLIKYATEHDEQRFDSQAYKIAQDFNQEGDNSTAQQIVNMLGGEAAETPQPYTSQDGDILIPLPKYSRGIILSKSLRGDVQAVINAVNKDMGFHRFLFHGEHGTGKTETVKSIAQQLDRKPYAIEVANLLTDDPTVTAGNIVAAFQRINSMLHPRELVILLHGIDILLQDDSYQAGIIRSTLLSQIDELDDNMVLCAETTGDTTGLASLFRRYSRVPVWTGILSAR